MGRVLEGWHVFVIQMPNLAKGSKIAYRTYSECILSKPISGVLFEGIWISLTPINVQIKGVHKTRV